MESMIGGVLLLFLIYRLDWRSSVDVIYVQPSVGKVWRCLLCTDSNRWSLVNFFYVQPSVGKVWRYLLCTASDWWSSIGFCYVQPLVGGVWQYLVCIAIGLGSLTKLAMYNRSVEFKWYLLCKTPYLWSLVLLDGCLWLGELLVRLGLQAPVVGVILIER